MLLSGFARLRLVKYLAWLGGKPQFSASLKSKSFFYFDHGNPNVTENFKTPTDVKPGSNSVLTSLSSLQCLWGARVCINAHPPAHSPCGALGSPPIAVINLFSLQTLMCVHLRVKASFAQPCESPCLLYHIRKPNLQLICMRSPPSFKYAKISPFSVLKGWAVVWMPHLHFLSIFPRPISLPFTVTQRTV